MILQQVAAGTLGAADAMVRFDKLLSRRTVGPAEHRELSLSFGENLARAVRRRFSAHDALEELRGDPVNRVAHFPAVLAARKAHTEAPTPANRKRLSGALIAAQKRLGIPVRQRSPLSRDEAKRLAGEVLKTEGPARLDAIRRLAADLQHLYGIHADLALSAVARHWGNDRRASAFTRPLVERMDDFRVIVADRKGQASAGSTVEQHSTSEAQGTLPVGTPTQPVSIEDAEGVAEAQGTVPTVRDEDGNFIRGQPLGEAVNGHGNDGFRDRHGALRLADPKTQVVLRDPDSGHWLVFERVMEQDQLIRGMIAPLVGNPRTGEIEFGFPSSVLAVLDAVTLPGDVFRGRTNPNSPEALGRVLDLGGVVSGGTFAIGAARRPVRRRDSRLASDGSPPVSNVGAPSPANTGVAPAAKPEASSPALSAAGATKRLSLHDARLIYDRDRFNRDGRAHVDANEGAAAAQAERNEWTRHFDYTTLFPGSIKGPQGQLRRNMLKDKSLGLQRFTGWQANHIVPWQQREHPLITQLGMNLNDPQNGVPLPVETAGSLSVHIGSHDDYNDAFKEVLNRIEGLSLPDERSRNVVAELVEHTRQALLGGVPQIMKSKGGTKEAWRHFFDRVSEQMGLFHNR